jgi:hypothetical protein
LKRIFTVSIIVLILVTACRTKQYDPEAYEALASLRKIQAATQVGVNYQHYGQLLIEAKDKANAASRVLPDGPLQAEIDAAMDAYVDAGQVWEAKTRAHLNNTEEPGRTLLHKYSIKTDQYGNIENEEDMKKALLTIWLNADSHLKKISELLDGRK